MFTFEDYQKAKVLKDLGYTIDTFKYNIRRYVYYVGATIEHDEPNEMILAYKGEKPDFSERGVKCTKLNTPYELNKVFDELFRNNLNG